MNQNAITRTISVEDAARLLGIGRAAAYQAVHTGEIPSIRIGKRLLVPRAELMRMLSEESHDSCPAPGLPDA